MKSPKELAEEIVAREGGYVDDPDDLGGATNHGVTIGTIIRLGFDKNGDGVINKEDVKALTRADATKIFLDHYFYGPRIDELPTCLEAVVFDMYVNAGGNAIKILQRTLNGFGAFLKVDGALGPITIKAAYDAEKHAADFLQDAYSIERRKYYFQIADRRPQNRKYVVRRDGGKAGWIKRAEEFMSPRFHLTQAQFKKRIAKWG